MDVPISTSVTVATRDELFNTNEQLALAGFLAGYSGLDALLVGREHGLFHLVCHLRDGDRVFETYWTKRRGAEVLDYSYALMEISPCSAGRRHGRTRRRAGHAAGTRPERSAGLPSGRPYGSGQAVVPPRSGHDSQPGTRTVWEPRARARRRLRITFTDGSNGSPSA